MNARIGIRHSTAVRVSVALVALGLGVWVRVSNYSSVFRAGTVFPLTPDSTYHFRRSLLAFAQFPHVPVFDRLMNWPYGAYCHWSNGFDFFSALFAKLYARPGDEYAAASAIVAFPVLLGIVCATLTAAAAHALCEGDEARDWVSLLTLCIALLLPIGVYSSLLGRTDHHVAEAASVAALCWWSLSRFPSERFERKSIKQRWAFELTGAALIAGALYLFDGSLLYAAPLLPPLVLATLRGSAGTVCRRATFLGSGAASFALAAVGTALLYAPNMREHSVLISYAFPSLLQPALLLLAAGACAAAVIVARLVRAPTAGPPWRRLAVLLTATCVAVGAAALQRGLRQQVSLALADQLLRHDRWMATIEEFQPLFSGQSALTLAGWANVVKYFGVFGPATPLLLPSALRRAARAQPERAQAFAWQVGPLLALSLLQNRYARPLWPLLSIWSALGVVALVRAGARQLTAARASALAGLLAATALLAALLSTQAVAGRLLPADAPLAAGPAASLFLSVHNAPRADGTRAGVLTSWGLGHQLAWPARSGVVANGFLFHVGRSGLEQVERALSGSEAGALALMRERDLRWLLIGVSYYGLAQLGPEHMRALVAAPNGGGALNLAFLQKLPLAVTMIGGSGIAAASVAHLQQLVPRWTGVETVPGLGLPVPELWVYEHVAGARLVGSAPAHARVVAQLELRVTGAGSRLPYEAWTDADGGGHYELRVALWNQLRESTLQSAAHWELRVPGRAPQSLAVTEAQVREGVEIPVPAADGGAL
jgi:hypothetical protein